jgi:hypothetical protein
MDGVLLLALGRDVAPARHADEFLDFTLGHFDLYWLIPYSQGDARVLLERLSPQTPPVLRSKLARIRPASFHIEKTEALVGDFYWLGPRPLRMERVCLRQRRQGRRWIEVNAYVRPDDLLRAVTHLRSVLARRPPPTGGGPEDPAPPHAPGSETGALGLGPVREPTGGEKGAKS